MQEPDPKHRICTFYITSTCICMNSKRCDIPKQSKKWRSVAVRDMLRHIMTQEARSNAKSWPRAPKQGGIVATPTSFSLGPRHVHINSKPPEYKNTRSPQPSLYRIITSTSKPQAHHVPQSPAQKQHTVTSPPHAKQIRSQHGILLQQTHWRTTRRCYPSRR